MPYGLQIAASGLLTSLYRQDVWANNLANMDTPGFKVDVPTTRLRETAREEDGLAIPSSRSLLERLGGGALLNPNRISLAQGTLRDTGNPLDVAIAGTGFFAVKDGSGQTRLTRDGRMTLDAQGRLVMASTGAAMMDDGGNEIRLTPGVTPVISGEGVISQNGAAVARLRMVDIADVDQLGKVGANLFSVPEDVLDAGSPAAGTLHQRTLEASGVDEIKALMTLTGVSRDIDGHVALIQQQDRLLDRAINTLGRAS
jgi:flagellar basal-body rod protein FlgG